MAPADERECRQMLSTGFAYPGPAAVRYPRGNGSGVAIETADIALMQDDLLKLPQAIGLARATVRVMRQNIAIALVTVAALLTGVFAGGVTMAIGMLVHEASVLLVIANAMRLLRPRSGRSAGAAADDRVGEPATVSLPV